jgi:hypothetical protein
MVSRLATIFTTVVVVIVFSTMIFAAEIVGTVSAIDDKGMATIKTTEGKELQVHIAGGEGRRQG